ERSAGYLLAAHNDVLVAFVYDRSRRRCRTPGDVRRGAPARGRHVAALAARSLPVRVRPASRDDERAGPTAPDFRAAARHRERRHGPAARSARQASLASTGDARRSGLIDYCPPPMPPFIIRCWSVMPRGSLPTRVRRPATDDPCGATTRTETPGAGPG